MDKLAELVALVDRQSQIALHRAALPCVKLERSASDQTTEQAILEPSIHLVLQGRKRATINGQDIELSAGQFLVVPVELPIGWSVSGTVPNAPFLGLSHRLRPPRIAEIMLQAGMETRGQPEPLGLSPSMVEEELVDVLIRLMRLYDQEESLIVMRPIIEREIVWRLLSGEQGAKVRHVGMTNSRVSQVARAIHWIRDHFADALRMDDLASIAGMSQASFNRHFRRVTSMSPLQFQKQIRLQEARIALLAGHPDIAQVGALVGYDNPSQFSREYRRVFGQPPSRDVARMRAAEVE